MVVEALGMTPTGAASGTLGGSSPVFTAIIAVVAITLFAFLVTRKRKARTVR